MRRQWLTGLIREVSRGLAVDSMGPLAASTPNCTLDGCSGQRAAVAVLMSQWPGSPDSGPGAQLAASGWRPPMTSFTAKFHRLCPNELWVTDITEHPTREGKGFVAP
jgi:hypothetical protein